MTMQAETLGVLEPTSDDPIHSHIIERDASGRDPKVLIMEARVNGTAVRALCGYTWIPSRDPERYPLCPKCKEIYEMELNFRSA